MTVIWVIKCLSYGTNSGNGIIETSSDSGWD